MIRILAVAVGLFSALGLSQFPEYSQQYTQRLSGAVDELTRIVVAFDADAAKLGMSRQEALEDLSASGRMAEARAESMEIVIARHTRLSADLTSLKASSAAYKALNINKLRDEQIARRALEDFQPAVPATAEGLGFAVVGFGLGYSLILVSVGFIGRFLWRRRTQA